MAFSEPINSTNCNNQDRKWATGICHSQIHTHSHTQSHTQSLTQSHAPFFIYFQIWTLVKHLSSRWALSTSERQLLSYSLLRSRPVWCSHMQLWMSVGLCSVFRISTKWLQHCLIVTWLLPLLLSKCKFCVHHTTMHQFTVPHRNLIKHVYIMVEYLNQELVYVCKVM